MSVPSETRFEHCHIVGGTGHGKTQLLQHLIHHDLQQAQDGKVDNVAGINAPFDEPIKPEVLLNTDQLSGSS